MANEAIGAYAVTRDGEDVVLKINYDGAVFVPSIEDNDIVMSRVVEALAEIGRVSKIVLTQKRDYEYDFTHAQLLFEIAVIYRESLKERIVRDDITDPNCPNAQDCFNRRYAELTFILFKLLKSDPLGAYVELKRILRRENIMVDKLSQRQAQCAHNYIVYLQKIMQRLEGTKMVEQELQYLAGYQIGSREPYRRLFVAFIKPDFMYTKFMASYPQDGKEIQVYKVGETEVTIFDLQTKIQTLYHMMPPEFRLPEEKYELLDTARRILAEHKPTQKDFTNPVRMRQVFHDIGSDLIEELAEYQGLQLKLKDIELLADILVRYTVGFGLIEVLLADEKIQDITVNSPLGRTPIFIVHADAGDCVTNVYPTPNEGESWASKLRLISGRPLDEANPILDTSLELPNASARIAVIGPPLNPSGLAYAFRRHRDKPWTLPLFVKARMMSPLAAGLISFLVDGSRTMLVAGTRSAGKTSVINAVIVEIMRRYRIITVEDTLELPVGALKDLGFNIQPMKVASALAKGGSEISAADGIRTTLRLGDSALIVGEVRSTEAKALYESMRVGALANVVAGTIHGDSPYGVYDRVVNDLEVPRTSFKATDIIIVANPIRSPDGLHRWRRITQITEVRKHWEDDPLREGGFVDLMKYDPKSDSVVASADLLNGDSDILKNIAGNVKEWAGNWDAVWDNIQLRSELKQTLVDWSIKLKNPDLLEADFYLQTNDQFHKISERVREEVGELDNKRILFEWNEWLKRALKKQEAPYAKL